MTKILSVVISAVFNVLLIIKPLRPTHLNQTKSFCNIIAILSYRNMV